MGEAPEPALESALRASGQEHLLAHARGLAAGPKAAFFAELARVPWERVAKAFREPPRPIPPELRPPEALTWRRQENEGGILRRLGADGEALLRSGKVATALLAGGQGSRLGHAGPKGTFALGPPDRTLYAILCERVLAASRRAGKPVPLVVLTGPDTDAPTRAAFESAGHYGLDPRSVEFVRQGELPALDAASGRALLAAPGRLALSPDGHGGLVEALRRAGALARLRDRGVEVLTTFQVDNPLGRPLDPVFLGWFLERKAVAAGKAVRKRDPAEKVGVFARDLDGRVRIVEYAEMPEGGLPDLVLGSIALHAFSLPWLGSLADAPGFALPYHKASKRVPYLGPDGRGVTPDAPNAVKLEQFLFDLLPLAPRVAIQEVDRRREFAPVKNASGEDSPETARAAVAAEIARWHRAAGVPVPDPVPPLRPLVADGPEDLASR